MHTVHQKPMLSVQTWMFETEKNDPISRRLDWNMFYVYIIVYKNDSFSILQLLILYSFSIEGLLVHYTTCRLIKKTSSFRRLRTWALVSLPDIQPVPFIQLVPDIQPVPDIQLVPDIQPVHTIRLRVPV